MSRPAGKNKGQERGALAPQRSHGRLRVAELLEAGAAVIAEKGYEAATMAEIAARAGAPIGSLYRFFPSKEVLADALIQRFGERVDEVFAKFEERLPGLSMAAVAEALLALIDDLRGERLAMRALLEGSAEWSAKREAFRNGMRRRIARTLMLRRPTLRPKMAANMAVIVLQNMKMVGVLKQELRGEALAGALGELREMTRVYLAGRLEG